MERSPPSGRLYSDDFPPPSPKNSGEAMTMNRVYEQITYIFDPIQNWWEREKMHRTVAAALVVFFIGALILIELKRMGIVVPLVDRFISTSHFAAIGAAFTVVLILEVISLIFTLPCSFSRAVAKQFELLALIMLRNAFKELSKFPEPIAFSGNEQAVLYIVSDCFGAVAIFALLGLFYLIQKQAPDTPLPAAELFAFVAAKKAISLLLLASFTVMGLRSLILSLLGIPHTDFLFDFYTLLIIADVLVVLISQCFQPGFYAIFRNSGFALSTVMVRIALTTPPLFNLALGIAAIIFAITLNFVCLKLFKTPPHRSH
jgi:hypothetical protein